MGNKKSYPYFHLLLRTLTICLLIGWMGVIYLFSDQPGDVSGDLSGRFSYKVTEAVNEVLHKGWSEEIILEKASNIDYPLRKAAHMTEYAILATLAFLATMAWPIRGKRIYCLSLIISILYAVTDEYHQRFVEGRAGRVFDVFIDALGALLALLIITLIICGVRRHRRNKCL